VYSHGTFLFYCPLLGAGPCSDEVAATTSSLRGQTQKRSPPTNVFDVDDEPPGSETNRHRENERMTSPSKRMRSADVEVSLLCLFINTTFQNAKLHKIVTA